MVKHISSELTREYLQLCYKTVTDTQPHWDERISSPVNFSTIEIWSGALSKPQSEWFTDVTLLQKGIVSLLRWTAIFNFNSCKMKAVTSLDTTPPGHQFKISLNFLQLNWTSVTLSENCLFTNKCWSTWKELCFEKSMDVVPDCGPKIKTKTFWGKIRKQSIH